ncbi:MAG: restriction endonuclease subunit S, partial [Coriobacteriaceae bacterium]|nr:restriction endonuclease subunit S [Coriobacteriaceae bacterium]
MQRYEAYKDSGIEWIGEIPEGWEVSKFRWVLKKVSRDPLPDDEVVTCFRDGEVTLRTNRRTDGFTMSDKEIGYQHICKGDFVIHGMDGFAGAMGISDSDGKASPVLMAFNARGAEDLRYMNYLLRFYAWQDVFLSLSTTIRVRSCDLNWGKVAPIPVILPFPREQAAIADYLDEKTAEIDSIVSQTERSIDLLREYRKSVISEAVTKGLDPNAPMKDSGVEWIGEIPEGWGAERLKTQLEERKESNNPIKTDFILSLTNTRGVIPYSEKGDIGNKAKEDLSSYRLARPGDIVLNSMNVVIGSVGLSRYFGAVSPVYYMLFPRDEQSDVRYFNYIFQMPAFQDSLKGLGNGIMEIRMRIPMSKLNDVKLPIPSTGEQRAIADYLDEKTAEIDSIVSQT